MLMMYYRRTSCFYPSLRQLKRLKTVGLVLQVRSPVEFIVSAEIGKYKHNISILVLFDVLGMSLDLRLMFVGTPI